MTNHNAQVTLLTVRFDADSHQGTVITELCPSRLDTHAPLFWEQSSHQLLMY